ncbi:MAG: DNA polymerase III subunit delta [Lentimicrobium sp.]|nr:DNA polymerase III subunit delta [Lentimicrobium sp.]
MKFSDIKGREEIKDRLIRSVRDNRVSHAQLFLGPEGSGKLALALAYAQYINCTQRTETDSCGECPSCIKYGKLVHPDLHFIYPVAKTKEITDKPLSKLFIASWREIVLKRRAVFNLNDWYQKIGLENKQGIINAEDCNEIIRTLSYKSYESEYKVMIIWMVEKLFHSAAPKILKILEEPPDKTLFILIAEQSELILPTILSRTQLIKFTPRNNQELVEALVSHISCSNEEANKVKNVAEGNLNKAIKIVESGESDQSDFELFRTWMRLCFKKDIKVILKLSNDFHGLGRERQKRFFIYCMKVIRFGILHHYENSEQVRAEGEELIFIQNFSPFLRPSNSGLIVKAFDEAHYHIERNGSANIIFFDISLKMISWLQLK